MLRRTSWRCVAVLALLTLARPVLGDARTLRSALESITTDELRQHTNVLASDTLEGREAGTRGGHAAGAYLITELKKLGVRPGGEASYYQPFGAGYRNVLAVLPGADPKLRQEYILVGAHYDHVGYGTSRNSLGPIGYIHNGADDNASGTAAVLELIEALALLDPPPNRSLLFAFWDAEEKGLLGSEHWVNNPTVPLNHIKLVVNLDMIGRLREETVEVYGTRTAAGLRRIVAEQNRQTDLLLKFNWDNRRDSDHYSFFTRRIPYLTFHTRKHENYHRPSDDVDTLNLPGMLRISRLLLRTVYAAAQAPQLPAFRSGVLGESESTKTSWQPEPAGPARLGVSWDGKLAKQAEIRLTRIVPNSPADRAGLKVGDRIVRFAGYSGKQLADFVKVVLAAENPARAVVEREGEPEPIELTLHLRGRAQRLGFQWREDDAEPGVLIVTGVTAGSAAASAGLKPNHRIYAISGRSFESGRQFRQLAATLPSPLVLLVEGRGQLREVPLDVLPALASGD